MTAGPGLVGSLLVGLSFGKALAYRLGVPFVGVHHLVGHLISAELADPELEPPARQPVDECVLLCHEQRVPDRQDGDGRAETYATSPLGDRGEETATPAPAESSATRRDRRREAAEQRRRLQPLRSELKRLEQAIGQLTAERATLEAILADPALYAADAKERLKGLLLEQARVDAALGEAEEAWLAVGEQIEAAQQD